MENNSESGIWEIFVPGLEAKARATNTRSAPTIAVIARKRPIPTAFTAEVRPLTASIVCDIDQYLWNDGEWMNARARKATHFRSR